MAATEWGERVRGGDQCAHFMKNSSIRSSLNAIRNSGTRRGPHVEPSLVGSERRTFSNWTLAQTATQQCRMKEEHAQWRCRGGSEERALTLHQGNNHYIHLFFIFFV